MAAITVQAPVYKVKTVGFCCQLKESLKYMVRGFQSHRCACKKLMKAAEQMAAIYLLLLVSLVVIAQSTLVYFGDTMWTALLTREACVFLFFF